MLDSLHDNARAGALSLLLTLAIALQASPASARTFAERAEDALDSSALMIEDMLEQGRPDLLAAGALERELRRLASDIAVEGNRHARLDTALDLARGLAGGRRDPRTRQVADLGLLYDALERVAADFGAGFLNSESSELPVADSQTVFDTGVRNWMPFAGVVSEVSEGAKFSGWDEDAVVVLVNKGGEIMLSIENNNYSARWLLPVPFARSISFGIDRDNEDYILLSIHAPDASTHFLIDGGGAGRIYVHRR